MNNKYENYYCNFILPKYGLQRNLKYDQKLVSNNIYPHKYSVTERYDFTKIPVISIDPEGCKDADDAFSIYEENNKLYLALHIADPTYYIDINSKLWRNIVKNTLSHYPSNNDPIHMMPEAILNLSSLIENDSSFKKAISIIIEIDKKKFIPINTIEIKYTNIVVKKSNALSYKSACEIEDLYLKDILEIGLKISNSLRNIRSNNTIGTKLGEINNAYPIYNEEIELYYDSNDQVLIKQMIAEFAIFANSFVGEYIKYHLGNMGIFRTCNTKEWLSNIDSDISGKTLLNNIIDNGISANYLSNVLSHDLVGSEVYCHFTSPIRRVCDCVCHYLLKYIHLRKNIECPFDKKEIDKIANMSHIATKNEKKIQHADSKFRLFQVMDTMLNNKIGVKIRFRMIGYTGLFLNCNITHINQYSIYMSYCIRIKDIKYTHYPNVYTLNITKINIFNKYDENTLPELDVFLNNLYT